MTAWQFLAYPAASASALGELTELRDCVISWPLTEPAEASFVLDGRHELAALVDELVVDLVILRDGVPVFRGRIGATGDDIDEDEHRATFAAVDYRGLLTDTRILLTSQVFSAVAQGSIVRSLIALTQGQSGGALGISATSTTVPDTATARTITFDPGRTIGESINDLAKLDNGFDWWIGADRVAWLASPARGTTRDLVLEYGSTVSKVRRTFDPTDFGNVIMATGADGVTPQVATAANIATRPEGRIERLESLPDITSTTVLSSLATKALAVRSTVLAAYTVTLKPGIWAPGDLSPGDTTLLVVRSGRLDVTISERVSLINVSIGEDAASETVEVTVGAIPASLIRDLRALTKRMTRVERLGG
jgi:hypothetical protein